MATVPTLTVSVVDEHILVEIDSNAGDDHVYLEKRFVDTDWILISNDIPAGADQTYADYSIAHNQTVFYRATAVDGSAVEAASLIASITQSLSAPVVHEAVKLTHTNKNGATLELLSQESASRDYERAETVQDMPGLAPPIIDVGTLVARQWTVNALFTSEDDITLVKEWRRTRAVLCLRNGICGERLFAVLPEEAINEDLIGSGSLTFIETDYRETITT